MSHHFSYNDLTQKDIKINIGIVIIGNSMVTGNLYITVLSWAIRYKYLKTHKRASITEGDVYYTTCPKSRMKLFIDM